MAEDNAVNQEIAKEMLEAIGCTFDVACDGREAVEAFRRGGYETHTGAGSKLTPEALSMVGDTAIALIQELFAP